ncbi:acetate--CoA ligase family protein [Thermoflexus sp.]|uniref:acetate--CoA ligase family protein n=1 Tax=Thermoflexus sp. TaxID=1969742 RepID=UPI0035E45957
MDDPLQPFFHARGVALVGASAQPTKLSYGVLQNLIRSGYPGPIYPVHPRGGELLGLSVYRSLDEVPDPVDLAILMVPAEQSVEALEACGRRGIRAAILVASGFAERGEEGREREEQLRAVARRHGIRFIGPNAVGLIDTRIPLNTTFIHIMPKPGPIGLVSHSGAVCGGILDWGVSVGIGFSRVVSLGNQADIDLADALRSLAADPFTRVVAAYVEGIRDGRRFLEAASEVSARKPLVILKAGRTPDGARAVASHTGALALPERIFRAAAHHVGAILVDHLEALIDAILVLALQPALSGTRVVILTNAGGPAAVGADHLARYGLRLADLQPSTQERLQAVTPRGAMVGNPVDMLGGPQPEHYAWALRALLEDPDVDAVMALFVPQAVTPAREVAAAIGRAAAGSARPVVGVVFGGEIALEAIRALHAAGVPGFLTPCRAAFALGVLHQWAKIQQKRRERLEPVHPPDLWGAVSRILEARVQGKWVLDPQAGAELAAAWGLPVPPSGLAATPEEAIALADRLGYPVALKRVAPGLIHKSKAGGVALNLRDACEVREAFARLIGPNEQALIQRMAPAGLEIIIGAYRDAQFGPVVMFGAGGVEVEAVDDVAFRLPPIRRAEAEAMLEETWIGRRLLRRGGRELEEIIDILRRVGQMMLEHPEIAEIDLNPLIVARPGEGVHAVDVRIALSQEVPTSMEAAALPS